LLPHFPPSKYRPIRLLGSHATQRSVAAMVIPTQHPSRTNEARQRCNHQLQRPSALYFMCKLQFVVTTNSTSHELRLRSSTFHLPRFHRIRWFVGVPTHSLTHPLTHSLTHPLSRSFVVLSLLCCRAVRCSKTFGRSRPACRLNRSAKVVCMGMYVMCWRFGCQFGRARNAADWVVEGDVVTAT